MWGHVTHLLGHSHPRIALLGLDARLVVARVVNVEPDLQRRHGDVSDVSHVDNGTPEETWQARACSRPSLHTMRAAIMFGRLRYDAKHTPTWLS